MADQEVIIPRETETEIDKKLDFEFDYGAVKDLYITKVNDYLSKETIIDDSPWRRTVNDKLIKDVNDGKECLRMHRVRTSDQYHAMKKFCTFQADNGNYILTKKTGKQDQVIVPCDESFDVIMKAHRNGGHLDKEKIYDILSSTHYLPKWCLGIMEQACNVCKQYKYNFYKTALKFNEKVNVEVYNMLKPDGYFKYVLIYEDIYTKYVQVKPLNNKNEHEIAMELLKIFMNFGPPMYLFTSNWTIIQPALDIVNMMCRLSCAVKFKSNNSNIQMILGKIKRWVIVNESDHWALGCQIVQWEYNNALGYNMVSPYERLFGQKPHTKLVKKKYTVEIEEIHNILNIVSNQKLCNQCNSTLTDIVKICTRCNKEVHIFCCQYNNHEKLLCFSCRDKENLLVKLRSTANKVEQLINLK